MMNRAPLFLLVDDSEDDVLLIQRAFEKTHLTNPFASSAEWRCGDRIFERSRRIRGPGTFSAAGGDSAGPANARKDGYDVLEWARAQPALRNIRIIVLTAFHSVYDVDMAYKMGANSFLVKPVEFESLVDLMRTLKGFWVWHAELPQPLECEEGSKLSLGV